MSGGNHAGLDARRSNPAHVHEPPDPLGRMPAACPAQRYAQQRRASISATALRVQCAQLLGDEGILAHPCARLGRAPAVIAAARHAKGPTQAPDPILPGQPPRSREALGDGSARMPNAFFKKHPNAPAASGAASVLRRCSAGCLRQAISLRSVHSAVAPSPAASPRLSPQAPAPLDACP